MKYFYFLIPIILFCCKKKDDPKPTTIFEGFTTKSFYGKYSNEIINHTWGAYDANHQAINRFYFRGDGNLYIKYDTEDNNSYTYSGTFDIPGDKNLIMPHYGEYIIDSFYVNSNPVMMKCYKSNHGDTTWFQRDANIVQ